MWSVIARVILRYRAIFIWLIVAMTFFMVQQSKNAKLSYSMARLLPKTSDTQLDFDYFVERFGQRDNVMVIGVKDADFFTLNHFQSWKVLADSIRDVEGVVEVMSVADAVNFVKDTESKKFLTEPVFSAIQTQTDLDEAVQLYRNLPFYEGMFLNEATNAYAMLVEIDQQVLRSDERIHVVEDIIEHGKTYYRLSYENHLIHDSLLSSNDYVYGQYSDEHLKQRDLDFIHKSVLIL